MPAEASHASRRSRRPRRAGGAGSGGMARPLAETVRRALRARGRPLEISAGEPGAGGATNKLVYSRCGDSAASGRAKCGHRVLPPFVRFSAVFAGRARAHSLQPVDDPRPRRCLLHPAPAPQPHPCT